MENERIVIEEYVYRYPQLTLPIEEGMSQSERYKNIVLRGKFPKEYHHTFQASRMDTVFHIDTPAGEAEVLYLADRKDFEHLIQALAYKCEKTDIPLSMGAMMISGIYNWHKIHKHKEEYLAAGGTDWKQEFRCFTKDAKNYKDTLLVISKGPYSALSFEETSYGKEEWENLSLTIRMYHELTHMVCRNLYPDKVDIVWDEIVADCLGIVKAIGYYDKVLAGKCLGVDSEDYRQGGRLENYLAEGENPQEYRKKILGCIDELGALLEKNKECSYWELLKVIQQEKEKIYKA